MALLVIGVLTIPTIFGFVLLPSPKNQEIEETEKTLLTSPILA